MASFQALVLHEQDGKVAARVEAVDEALLPAGEVTVAIEYSTLNYKDGMILQGIGRLVRNYPHIPGIDFAGIVERSDVPDRHRVEEIRDRQLHNSQEEEPRTVLLDSRNGKHPRQRNQERDGVTQEHHRFWRSCSLTPHENRKPCEGEATAERCGHT